MTSKPGSGRFQWVATWTEAIGKHGLLVALIVSSCVAYFWPADVEIDPFRLSSNGLRWLVSLTMLCLGLIVNRAELRELREHPWAVLLGVAVQCTLMPFLGWFVVRLLGLEGPLAQGVILVGCVPGAMASNVLTMTARGNVSYSISLTTVATLLSPLSVPMALSIIGGIASEDSALNPWQQSQLLLGTVVIPVLAGFAIKELWADAVRWAVNLAPGLASVALLWIIASVVAGNRERLGQIESIMLLALLTINLLGYLGGGIAGRLAGLSDSMRRALALEVGMQNAGLGTFLAAQLFGDDSAAQIPTAAYTFGCMLTGTVLASWWHYQIIRSQDHSDRASI